MTSTLQVEQTVVEIENPELQYLFSLAARTFSQEGAAEIYDQITARVQTILNTEAQVAFLPSLSNFIEDLRRPKPDRIHDRITALDESNSENNLEITVEAGNPISGMNVPYVQVTSATVISLAETE